MELREGGADHGLGPAPDPIRSQLEQLELDWSGLVEDVPAVLCALQEVRPGRGEGGSEVRGHPPSILNLSPQWWVERSDQRGALQELQTWAGSAEAQLEGLLRGRGSSGAELRQRLKDTRVTHLLQMFHLLQMLPSPPPIPPPLRASRQRCLPIRPRWTCWTGPRPPAVSRMTTGGAVSRTTGPRSGAVWTGGGSACGRSCSGRSDAFPSLWKRACGV